MAYTHVPYEAFVHCPYVFMVLPFRSAGPLPIALGHVPSAVGNANR